MLNWLKGNQHLSASAATLKRSRTPLMMQLEQRIMFDGAMAVTAADAVPTIDAHAAADASHAAIESTTSDPVTAPLAAPAADTARHEVLFVDTRVVEAGQLIEGSAPGTEIVYLTAQQDGLEQIATYLAQHQGASSVQIIAHGNAGELWLGNSHVSADNVQSYSAVLAEIGNHMQAGGDILIYGCYTAEGEGGSSFIDSLAQLTGRDVAASDDRTGLGGDWDLEITTGSIESTNVLSAAAMSEYEWGLATWTATNNLNSGVGSLRAALASAQNGDIVTFNASMTVALTQVLVIDKNITVDGDLNNDNVADVTLDGQNRTQVINVTAGTTATLDGLVITRGMVAGNGGNGGDDALPARGGGIYNAGTLTLRNVTVTANAASGGGGGGGVTPQYAGGGGGGGGAIPGGTGGRGGDTLNSAGSNGSSGQGGAGGGFFNIGGRGGSSTGGAGGAAYPGYSTGSAGGTASSAGRSIGGGGGGDGYNDIGGAGGGAVGGIYNDTGATLRIIGNSVISNNIGAGGGGGGGGAGGGYNQPGGAGGVGVGAIWNRGSILITSANFAALAGNAGGSGVGGTSAGTAGVSPASVANVYGDGGTINTSYVPDETPPTATVVVANTNLNSGGTSLVTITFSEAVTGLTASDLTVQNGTVGVLSSGDGGITWTGTLTAASNIADATNVITLNNTGVADLAGNAGVGTTDSNNYVVNDTVAPTAGIVVADTALRSGETSLVTITFSEAVSGFTAADLTVANGTLSGLSSSDGGITWTATLTPDADITDTSNLVTLNNTGVADLNGNAGVGTTNSNNYAIDTLRPTATIVVADTALSAGETSLVTITFNEAVSGFTTADLTVANGTVTGLSSGDGGITWTGTLTPSASVSDTTNLITLNNNGVADLSGNVGTGTTDSNNYAIDTLRPTASIVVTDTALRIGETSLVTITFSEAVTGFTLADLTVANGSLSGLSSSDGGITWTATLTPSVSITDATNLIVLANTGVLDAAGNAGTGTTSSNNYAVDTQRPTATVVVADNALAIGETSLVTITFSEAVTGFTTADLTVANGAITGLSSSDGGITWTGTLTPSASITDTTNLVTLDNTGVSDAAGNAGTGTADSNNYAVDTVRPTATLVVADTAIAVGETSLVTITFSEAVTGFTLADLTVANGSLSGLSTSDNITYTATFTPSVGISDTTNLITLNNSGVVDGAGNDGTGTTQSNNYAVDTQRPTASIVVADTALVAGETSTVTITFNEAVSGLDASDFTVANGALSGLSSLDGGITWTAMLTPTASITDTTNLIMLANTGVQDAAGNTGTGTTDSNNYAIDTLRPSASIVVADTALSIGETTVVTITFNEAVTGLTTADFTAANGVLSGLSSADGGITWTATLTPTASTTDTTNLITLANAGVQDAAGNTGTGTTESNNYAIDTLRPTANIVVADAALGVGETSLVTMTFNEAVTGFTNADLTVANGSLSAVSSSDGGVTWTATLTPIAGVTDPTNLITLANTGVQDAAGNTGVGTTDSNNYAIDALRPSATIVVADTALAAGETSLVTITMSEAVANFDNADLSAANGTLSTPVTSDGGTTWTATLTPDVGINDATNVVTFDSTGVIDGAGNAGAGPIDSNNYAIDTLRPTATIVVADTALAVGETSLVTITFNEAVTGFTAADLTVANGIVSGLSSADGGITWTATLTPAAATTDTTNLITLDDAGVQDAAGNTGTGTTDSNNYAIDSAAPTATVVVADTALAEGETSLVTITFSEPVSGFTNADLSIANGTLSAVTSSDGGVTWTATLTPAVDLSEMTNVIRLNNDGVFDLAGNTGLGTTDSNNYAIDTLIPTVTSVSAPASGTYVAGQNLDFAVNFSEAVVVNTAGGVPRVAIALDTGGTAYADYLSGTGSAALVFRAVVATGQLDLTGISVGTVLDLNGGAVRDAQGNNATVDLNNVANTGGVRVDAVVPTATLAQIEPASPGNDTIVFELTTSEDVSGVHASDFTLINTGSVTATVSNVQAIDAHTYRVTVSDVQGAGTLAVRVVAASSGIVDAAGNGLAGDVTSSTQEIAAIPHLAPDTEVESLALPATTTSSPPATSFIVLPAVANVATAWSLDTGFGLLGTPTIESVLASLSFGDDSLGLSSNSLAESNRSDAVTSDTGFAVSASAPYVSVSSGGGALLALPDLGPKNIYANESFSIQLPRNTFSMADRDATQIKVTVRQANGESLPSWLRFDASSGTFSGRPPVGWTGRVDIVIVASDDKGNRATSVIHFEVKVVQPAARAALETQFKNARAITRDVDLQWLRQSDSPARPSRPAARVG